MTDHAHVVRIAHMRPKPGQRDQLIARLHEQAEAMRPLPGLFGIQVCEVQEDPSSVALISRWQDEQAMEAADKGPAGAAIRAAAELVEHEDVQHLVSV
jgi:quinol monooxygenase YgiN